MVTPNWILSNVTEFNLNPYQELGIKLSISPEASVGMNDIVEIISQAREFPDIHISVYVAHGKSSSSQNGFFIFLAVLSLLVTSGVSGFAFYQRDAIGKIIANLKNNRMANPAIDTPTSSPPNILVTPNGTFTDVVTQIVWDTIQFRWETILSESELKVVEILFHNGSMNQQSIADQMEVSKMMMSRLLSRLERKRILFRDRSGMSNKVKLNMERL